MSARKVASRYMNTPGTGSASKSNLKTKPPTPKQVLNSTIVNAKTSKTSPRLKGNLNVNATFNTVASAMPKTPATDWGLDCDFAYSKYLRALITRDIMYEAVKVNDEALDDQLSWQMELLMRRRNELNKLLLEIENLQTQSEIGDLYTKLQQFYAILQPCKVEKNINIYIKSSENVCNELYLKNIKSLKTQEDCDKFAMLLERCSATLEKLRTVIGNSEDVQRLGEHMEKFIEVKEEFLKKQKMLHALQANVVYNMFKNVSDKFAMIRGYGED